MASYYYLISSLPMLRTDSPMPFSYETFLSMCEGVVPQSTYSLLENLSVNSSEGPLIKEWSEFYGKLAREMNYQRNQKLGKAGEQAPEHDDEISRIVSTAINAKNPLEAELMLLSLEFDKLDDLVGLHYFDDYKLFAYALKLKLLQRKTVFDFNVGKEEFRRLFDGIQAKILSI